MNMLFAIACGGDVGSISRHFISNQAIRRADGGAPWSALIVNVASSFVLGLFVIILAQQWSATQKICRFLVVGLLGGFTTFSGFLLGAFVLLERGSQGPAFAYICGGVFFPIGKLLSRPLFFQQELS